MKDLQAAQLLQGKGLKKTKLRLALLNHFVNIPTAQSYADIKQALSGATDKSTLYRNLAAFEEAGIIHSINDHSGISKYAFGKEQNHGSNHAHFVCEKCETVYCIEDTTTAKINLPKGFKTKDIQTIIKGTCSDC